MTSDPLNDLDKPGSRLFQPPKKFFSRKERKVRKEMEGGKEASVASGITQFAEGEPKRREVFIPKRRSRKPPLDGACLGRLLDGFAVKELRKPPKIFFAE